MHNALLVLRREYIERVRSKAFILFTFLVPALMYALIVLPSKLMSMKPAGTRKVVVVSADKDFAQRVASQIELGRARSTDKDDPVLARYKTSVATDGSPSAQQRMNQQIADGTIDGYLLLPDDVAKSRKFTYYTKNASDFVETETMRGAVRNALFRTELAKAGVSEDLMQSLSLPVDVDTLRVDKGKVTKSGGMMAFILPMILMMMIYMTVLVYGFAVMRSIIEEKSSRVIEVMLSSVSPGELMAGKILGVGAVGLTQIAIWVGAGLVIGSPALMAAKSMSADLSLPVPAMLAFPVFFVLGYVLYSSFYGAMGATLNSDEEAQQMQLPLSLPLILAIVFAMMIIRQPDSPIAFWMSIFPLTSPILMFLRIVVHTPPMWQIALSVVLLVVTIAAVVWLSARIYRVGILMYGKRPTLPEILKWVRYSD